LPGSKESTAHSTVVSGYVPRQLADELRRLAAAGERSLAARQAVSTRELQEWMRHADAATTARYTSTARGATRQRASPARSPYATLQAACKQATSPSLPVRSAVDALDGDGFPAHIAVSRNGPERGDGF
jgi:hypothetical protein